MKNYRSGAEMDQALEEDPPVIRWESNGKGILVGTVIRDPYAERQWRRDEDRPLPPENYDGCTCRGRCNTHEEN